MSLFGRTGCEERTWKVVIYLTSDNQIDLTQQIPKSEATKFYKELKKTLQDNSNFIEVETDNGDDCSKDTRLFNKANITHIKLTTD